MALDRINSYTNITQTETHDRELDLVFEELNKGVDVKTIGPKAITSDKIRILSGGVIPPDYFNLGQVGPGAWSLPVIINIGATGAISEGANHYIDKMHWDIYVSNTSSVPATPSPYSTAQIVSINVDPAGLGGAASGLDNFIIKWYPTVSGPTSPPAGFLNRFIFQLKNDDSVAHYYWLIGWVNIIGTQLTGGS